MRFTPELQTNRPLGPEDWIEHKMTVLDVPLAHGVELGRHRAHSPNEDLRIMGIANVEDSWLGLGFRYDTTVSGRARPVGPVPNLRIFAASVIEALAPAFDP